MALPSSAGHLTDPDEEGKRVLFLQLLTPLARDRSRKLSRRDPAANDEPLLVTVLLPDFAFGLSEVEAAYGFELDNTFDSMGANFGDHIIVHQDCMYVEGTMAFAVVGAEHPSLLLALAHPFTFERDAMITMQLRELLQGLNEILRRVEDEASLESAHAMCVRAFEETEATLKAVLSSGCPLRDVMIEAYVAILADERQTLDILDADVMPEDIDLRTRTTRRARRRLARLRRVIPQ